MSENANMETEQTIQEETVQNQEIKEQVKEEKKEEKKGILKKGSKDKARIEELEKKVAELENKTAKDKDDYIRLMAEFDNFRRRTSQEKLELVSMASTDTIKSVGRTQGLERQRCCKGRNRAHLPQADGLPEQQGTCSH